MSALRLYDAVVAAAPLDFEARLKVADCLAALGEGDSAAKVYRAVSWYALKTGHPLAALVAARVLDSLGAEYEDILAALVVQYGCESELIGKFAGRINTPDPATPVPDPQLHDAPPVDFLPAAAQRAADCTDDFDGYPTTLHPIPLLSSLSEDAFRRVLGTLVVRRMSHGQSVICQGEPGQSFFFVATGEVRVFMGDAMGRESELARLHENAVFGEMALISALPRSASVQVVGEADLLEVTRQSLAVLADELAQVATALHGFTRERLLRNLLATHPFFRPFNRAQRRDLLCRFTSHDVAAGTDIIRQGEEGRGLFVVLAGEVEVAKTTGRVAASLATLRAGDIFGEMSILRGGPTTATVCACRPTTVLFLARGHVSRIVAGVPEIKRYLEALAEDRQLDTRLTLDSLAADSVEQSRDAMILI
ncbi:MAG: cyclic nucleotide-binding domain-containing protein [Proteobacteria bacterium]|nr:cyclic nucleotide-binding domain-containing protein [Pseudomonadota bacterium]